VAAGRAGEVDAAVGPMMGDVVFPLDVGSPGLPVESGRA